MNKGDDRTTRDGWPKVSIVTPSFQQARFLEDTILSVINHGYPRLEYFVFDGGSSDGSRDILERYSESISYWESVPDRGQSHAINKGWERATGEYLWWINSDDLLSPGSLHRSVSFLEEHPEIGFVYGDLLLIGAEGEQLGRQRYPDFHYESMLRSGLDISQAGGLLRRSCLDRVGFLNEELHFMMDLDFWHRLALEGVQLAHLPDILAHFRVYDETKTQASSARVVEERYSVAAMICSHPRFQADMGISPRCIWGNVHLISGRNYAKAGYFGPGLRECWRAAFRSPQHLFRGVWWHTFAINLAGLLVGRRLWLKVRGALRRARRSSASPQEPLL